MGAFKSFYVCTEHKFIDHIIVPLCQILKMEKWNTEGYNTSSDVIYVNIGYAFKGGLAIICSPQRYDSRGL